MARALLVLVAVAMFAAATFIVPASASQAAVFGIELLPHPDQDGLGRRGRVSILADAVAGETVEREVRVSNQTRASTTVDVYVGDARIGEDGFVPADGEGTLESWSAVSPSAVDLGPGEVAVAKVSILVPLDAANGEHYGVVWLQPPASSGDVSQVNRVGIRIYLNIVGGVDPTESDFTIDQMTATRLSDGRAELRATVSNTGQRAVDLVGELQLSGGPGGSSAGPFPTAETTTVGVGAGGIVSVALPPGLPSGPWAARLVLTSGDVERAAEATVTFPGEAGQAAPVPAAMTPVERRRQVLVPLVGSLITALLVITLVLLISGQGRRASR